MTPPAPAQRSRSHRPAAAGILLLLLIALVPGCVSFAPRVTDLPGGHVEFPLDTDLVSPLVEVSVNGRGPYTFVLDTGASALVVSRWLTEELKLPTESSPYRLDDPKGRRSGTRPLTRIDTLQLGDATFKDVRAVVDPLEHPWATPRIAGVIGCAVLTNCRLTVDLAAGSGRLDAEPLDPAAGIPIGFTEMVPLVPVIIDPGGSHQTGTQLQLDTGYGGTLALPKSLQAAAGPLHTEGQAVAWTIGGTDTEDQYYAPATFIIGGEILRGIHGVGLTSANQGRVGAALLRHYVVTIDWRSKCLQFRARDEEKGRVMTQVAPNAAAAH